MSFPGLASIAKILLSLENKCLPGNLHFSKPNPSIPAVVNETLKVVSTNTEWNGGIVGVNSFGFGGANVHVILRGKKRQEQTKHIDNSRTKQLILSAGRTKEGCTNTLRKINEYANNQHFQKLIRAYTSDRRHTFREFGIVENNILSTTQMQVHVLRIRYF